MNAVRWSIFTAIAALLFLGIYMACSNNSGQATAPGSPQTANWPLPSLDQGSGHTGLWGYYSVAVYPAERKVDITPLRTAGMTINVLPFMHGPNGEMACLTIEILEYQDLGVTGDCLIGVNLKHPYPEMAEFCGFDVMGLFIADGSGQGVQNPALRYPIQGQNPVLINADGYTRWMNPTEFPGDAPFGYYDPMSEENSGFIASATINGYKYFADGLGPEEDVEEYFSDPGNCSQRGLFSYGGQCTRNYQIRFPLKDSTPQIFFNYAVLASWSEPLPSPPEHIPADFPRDANAQFPIYASVNDYSTLYHTDDEAGGDIILDVELFDWSNFWTPDSLKDKISRVVLESNDGLIADNHWEASNPSLTMFHGDTPISSHLIITVPGNPPSEGFEDLFLAVEIDSPSGYNQGYGEIVPAGPLALYLEPRVEIGTCPGAVITGISKPKLSFGEKTDDIEIYGTGFKDGPDLAVRFTNTLNGDIITGLNTQYVSDAAIKTDIELLSVKPGAFDIVCTNGCGTESAPPKNLPNWDGKIKILSGIPKGITLSTGRTGPGPSVVDSLSIDWEASLYADSYRLYIDKDPYSSDDIDGLVDDLVFLAETTSTSYKHTPSSPIPFNNHSNFAYVVKSYTNIGSGNGESKYSYPVMYCGQDFALFNPTTGAGLNGWGYTMQSDNPLMGCIHNKGYSGYGFSFDKDLWLPSAEWLVINTPVIPSIPEATKVHFEFNHRHEGFKSPNGYFVGYIANILPPPGHNTVTGVTRITSAAYGAGYNDTLSSAIMCEFNYPTPYINNFQKTGYGWWGWYMSGFDLSDMLEGGGDHYGLIGMAFSDGGSQLFELDDCALLIY